MSAQRSAGQHVISVMHSEDASRVHNIQCDLATLTLGQLYGKASAAFGLPATSFDLIHMSAPLQNDNGVKAIDIGLSNNMFLLLQPEGAQYPFDLQVPQQVPVMHSSPFNTSPHMMPMMPHNTSPTMMPSMMSTSPPMQPVSPISDPYLDQYDLALAQTLSSHLQLNAVLNFSGVSPSRSPTSVPQTSMPVPVSPPLMRESSHQRMQRPTGSVNLNSMDLCAYAMTNEGSRATVAAIEETEDVHAVTAKIVELTPKFGTVASHQHGSKVVRALMKKADQQQLDSLLQAGCGFLEELCDSNTGSDVFVEIIATCSDDKVKDIVAFILASGINIAKSINGRKIIVAVLSRWTEQRPRDVEPIFDMVGQNLVHLAQDQTGCVTIQRCLDNAKDTELKTQLQMQIMSVAQHLFADMYGNYVLQHAIKGQGIYGEILANKLSGRVSELATNKYSSCVIEKVLLVVGDKVKEAIINEVLVDLKKLMWDGFGNFVVQSAVDSAPANMLDKLKAEITPYISDCPYGYRIEGKLNKRVKKNGRRSVPQRQERSMSPEIQNAAQAQQKKTNSPKQQTPMTRVALNAQQTKPNVTIVAAP